MLVWQELLSSKTQLTLVFMYNLLSEKVRVFSSNMNLLNSLLEIMMKVLNLEYKSRGGNDKAHY